jgi:hypothetical protein
MPAPSVLPRRHTVFMPAASREQELAGFFAGRPDVVVYRLAGLFRQSKPNGSPSLFLAHRGPVGSRLQSSIAITCVQQ